MIENDAYDALCSYALSLGDADFIHQHVVDAFTAQRADEGTKPVALAFALVGLYLSVEKAWNGRQVQRAHMLLARRKRAWPAFPLPRNRGSITAVEVLDTPEGPGRARAIHAWCACVWAAFAESRQGVADLLRQYDIV